jgi:hypothetical protein
MCTLAEVRSRPFDAAAVGQQPAMIHVRTPYGTVKVGISREDASDYVESNLFDVGLAVISLSGWSGTDKRDFELAEGLAVLHQLLGPTVLPMLRAVTLGGGAMYFIGLVRGASFVAPTMLQDAVLARRLDARVIIPK